MLSLLVCGMLVVGMVGCDSTEDIAEDAYNDAKDKVEDTAEKDLITACIDMIIWISDHMAKENYKIEFDKTKW